VAPRAAQRDDPGADGHGRLQFANLITGTIVVENVFVLPGIGRLVFQAISNRDLVVVRDVVMLLAAVVVVVNFVVDVLYALVDPRLRRLRHAPGLALAPDRRRRRRLLARALRHPSFVVGALLSRCWRRRRCCRWCGRRTRRPRSTSRTSCSRPVAAHWLGTDSLGRDIASQLLVGAQNSIVVGVIAVGIGLALGVALGCLAAARRGWVEELVMRASDFTFAFPALLSAIMLTAIYGPGW
jgi:ABC-type dipeptide/oligopeptide/nickel transport system permease subunit